MDSFVQQMRDIVTAQTRMRGVSFSQTGKSQPV